MRYIKFMAIGDVQVIGIIGENKLLFFIKLIPIIDQKVKIYFVELKSLILPMRFNSPRLSLGNW